MEKVAARATADVPLAEDVDRQAWFFKVTGSADVLASRAEEFFGFLESLQFDNTSPRWTLPEGWSEKPASGMRFATLWMDGADPPLEISVIPLPVPPGDSQQYIRSNIDRWRGQLGMPPLTDDEWRDAGRSVPDVTADDWEVCRATDSDRPVTLVRLNGTTDELEEALVLGAIVMPPVASAARAAAPPRSSGLTYQKPDSWAPGRSHPMRQASFAVHEGTESVDISVSMAGGDDLMNVNRWRGEIGLSPDWTLDDLSQARREIVVDGYPGLFVELVGEEETTLGVIVRRGSDQWFFKLRGSNELAQREQANFESFVKSVKFE